MIKVGKNNKESEKCYLKSIHTVKQTVTLINIYKREFHIICSALNGALFLLMFHKHLYKKQYALVCF